MGSTPARDRATLPRMTFRPADVRALDLKLKTEVRIGQHVLAADETKEDGGDDIGPAPHDFLLAALGACTSMTVRLYAQKKGIPLTDVHVHLVQEKGEDGTHRIHRTIELEGALDDAQQARLVEIANKCPVHRTLSGKIQIETNLGKPASP
jgi:putative redox protein